jgi:hypothetical protein
MVKGTRNQRYDCPDLATLDRHITRLRHRVTTIGSRSPEGVAACRADIDLLLDRRAWLTLLDAPTPRRAPTAGSELTTAPPGTSGVRPLGHKPTSRRLGVRNS